MASTTTPAASTPVERLMQQQQLEYQRAQLLFEEMQRPDGFTPEREQQYNESLARVANYDERITRAQSDANMLVTLEQRTGGSATRLVRPQTGSRSWGQQFVAATGDFF